MRMIFRPFSSVTVQRFKQSKCHIQFAEEHKIIYGVISQQSMFGMNENIDAAKEKVSRRSSNFDYVIETFRQSFEGRLEMKKD